MPSVTETTEARYLTYSQASAYCGLSIQTLRRLIYRGLLRASRPVPQRILIARDELDRYMAECAVPA